MMSSLAQSTLTPPPPPPSTPVENVVVLKDADAVGMYTITITITWIT